MTTRRRRSPILYETRLDATPIGPVTVLWTRAKGSPRLVAVRLAAATPRTGAAPARCAEIDTVCAQIKAVLNGRDVRVPLPYLPLDTLSVFQQAVLRATHAIPRGAVQSYAGLARAIGRPGAARAVGRALAANPFPILIPCHRVIRSDGTPGGFTGGTALKRLLLEREGGWRLPHPNPR
jgi:methylated-DNA-[protein]-cysteine S-methyltransferase